MLLGTSKSWYRKSMLQRTILVVFSKEACGVMLVISSTEPADISTGIAPVGKSSGATSRKPACPPV